MILLHGWFLLALFSFVYFYLKKMGFFFSWLRALRLNPATKSISIIIYNEDFFL